MEYFKILLVGRSGMGKTYSFRNMNRETTGFVNIENKPLPFKGTFKYHARPTNITEAKKALSEFATNPDITTLVIDSFSSYVDMILTEARITKRGFDVWSFYSDEIGKFLNSIKKIDKEVYMTAHYEWLQGEEGVKEMRVKVKGKEWEGLIESQFTIVLYADNKLNEKGIPEYYFLSFKENSSSKCPPDIFGESVYKLDNDCNYVSEKITEFLK